jgi:hypothetical protein
MSDAGVWVSAPIGVYRFSCLPSRPHELATDSLRNLHGGTAKSFGGIPERMPLEVFYSLIPHQIGLCHRGRESKVVSHLTDVARFRLVRYSLLRWRKRQLLVVRDWHTWPVLNVLLILTLRLRGSLRSLYGRCLRWRWTLQAITGRRRRRVGILEVISRWRRRNRCG